jgi:3-hydroxybutyryl-CoA dehydratase
MNGRTLGELQVGDKASFSKTISETDVYLYAGITGDLNPAHIDEQHAKETLFQTRIAHGMLTAGLVSAVLGMKLPGPGTIYLAQTLKFTAPVHFGDTLTATAEVAEILAEKKRVKLATTVTNQEGQVVLEGEALVKPPL